MTLNQILRISKKENLCIVEILLLYLLSHNDFTKNSPLSQYMDTCGTFSMETLKKLTREKYLDNFNSPNEYYPEMYSLTEKSKTMFADVTIGEEFWKAYEIFYRLKKLHVIQLIDEFNVDGEDAHERWLGFKPPE